MEKTRQRRGATLNHPPLQNQNVPGRTTSSGRLVQFQHDADQSPATQQLHAVQRRANGVIQRAVDSSHGSSKKHANQSSTVQLAQTIQAKRLAPSDVSFELIFQDQALYKAFYAQCESEYVQENLHFLDLAKRNNYKSNLKIIIDEFIRTGSPQQVNVSGAMRANLINAAAPLMTEGEDAKKAVNFTKAFARVDRAMSPIITEICNILQFDAFLRFKKTRAFRVACGAPRRKRGEMRL